jgi:hypothetical protein
LFPEKHNKKQKIIPGICVPLTLVVLMAGNQMNVIVLVGLVNNKMIWLDSREGRMKLLV